MENWTTKEAIAELKRVKDLHFANPDKKEWLRRVEFSNSKQFRVFTRMLLGIRQ